METTALIMAGGRGERFWPKSRTNLPKQFLSLTDDGKTMIQLTVERILPLVRMENVFIATNASYRKLVMEQLPELPESNILCEPVGRNTAPCIGLGAIHIAKKYPDALMMVLPSDHLIKLDDSFRDVLSSACKVANQGRDLLTIGITPSYPETGYGYIKFNKNIVNQKSYGVERFVEKPNFDTAKTYLESGEYLWNSGMFVWKVSSILENMKQLMPETYESLIRIQATIGTAKEEDVLKHEFEALPSQSIDYGIMEKAEHIYTIPGNFGWDDVGSWLAVERIQKTDSCANVVSGNVISVGTERCTIQADKKLIAAVGLKDLIIVDTEDATLICAKDACNDIKKIPATLKEQGRSEYI